MSTKRKTKPEEKTTTSNFVAKYAHLCNKAGFHESKKYNRKSKHKKQEQG